MTVPVALHGQSVAVSGTVVDSSGLPIPGVGIFEPGNQSNGVVSDIDGNWTLEVSGPDSQITFSCIGYEPRTLTAAELSKIANLVLNEDSIMLENAVAIGYGIVRKEDLTGSVSAVKAEEINRGVITSADELLKGKLSGVQIIPGGALSWWSTAYPSNIPHFRCSIRTTSKASPC